MFDPKEENEEVEVLDLPEEEDGEEIENPKQISFDDFELEETDLEEFQFTENEQ